MLNFRIEPFEFARRPLGWRRDQTEDPSHQIHNVNDNTIIHVIDDSRAVCNSLSALLLNEGYSVRCHQSARTFLDTVREGEKGCVVTDVLMPDMSGLDLLAKVKERGISLPIIIVTGYANVSLAMQAMKMGAANFLEKPFDPNILLACVRGTVERKDNEAAREAEAQSMQSRLATLTEQEKDVLTGLSYGKSNKMIAHELGISIAAAEVYRANVMLKTQANSLVELMRMLLVVQQQGYAKPLHEQ